MTMINLNDLSHTFIIAEAGSNWKSTSHEDDIRQAKELIKVAAKTGANAIKFQIFRSETVYATNAGTSKYLSKSGIKENINKIFVKNEMPYDMIPELVEFCGKNHIMFMSTPFSVNDAKQIDPFVQIHKVASFEINHVRLLEFLAKTNKPIIISTGASTYEEIDFAVNTIKKFNKKISILQCTSKYPCPLESLNLSVIPHLKLRYGFPVGLSDHSTDPIIGPILTIGFLCSSNSYRK